MAGQPHGAGALATLLVAVQWVALSDALAVSLLETIMQLAILAATVDLGSAASGKAPGKAQVLGSARLGWL